MHSNAPSRRCRVPVGARLTWVWQHVQTVLFKADGTSVIAQTWWCSRRTPFFFLVRLCYLNQRTSLHVWAAHGGTWGGTIQQQVLRTPPQLLLHLRPRKYLSGGATPESTLQHTHSPQHPPTLSTGCHQCPGSQSTPGPHPLKSSHAAGLSITHRTASGCQRHNHLRDHPKDTPDYSRTPSPID